MSESPALDSLCAQKGWTWYCREPAGAEIWPKAWLNRDGYRVVVEAGTLEAAVSGLEEVARALELGQEHAPGGMPDVAAKR